MSTRNSRYSQSQWIAMLDEQASSGLTEAVWCRRKGVDLSTFNKWKRRIESASNNAATSSSHSSRFLDLTPELIRSDLRLTISENLRLDIPQGTPIGQVAQLIQEIRCHDGL